MPDIFWYITLYYIALSKHKNREKEGKFIKTCIFSSECFAVSKKHSIFALAFREKASSLTNGVVVQLVRIPACHAGGRGFESRPYRKKKIRLGDIISKKDGPFVYRLVLKIFILARGVRFPHGLLIKKIIKEQFKD